MSLFRDQPSLLEDFRCGRPSALEAVYWRYVNVVAKVIREGLVLADARRVAGAHVDARQDLVQETFMRAFKATAREAFDGKRLYQPYLLTICRNLLIDWTRKQGREVSEDDVQALVEKAAATPVPSDEPSEDWADPQTMVLVERYVSDLDPVLRGVYEERYVRGASQVEAAEHLKLTRQRIRTLEAKLRDGLRQALDV